MLEVVLYDYAGIAGPDVPAAFLTPSTDIHARLLKIERGEITALEDVVRRVPYGQSSPWGPPLRLSARHT